MIENELISRLLEIAVNAPSGDNSQPWRFEFDGNNLSIYSLPEKDNPKFNFRNRGTYVAHGALIENIIIASPGLGLKPTVQYLPNSSDATFTAQINFEKTNQTLEPLAHAISQRTTNRKRYASTPLTPSAKEDILKSTEEIGEGRILLAETENEKQTLGRAVSVNEIVMLEDQELHRLFFGDVLWKESDKDKPGLYLKTMELEKPKELTFRLLSSWNRAKLLTKLGIAKFIAKENAKIYSSGAALGAVVVANEDKSFITAGRIMERIWVKATRYGFSVHPITGIIYLAQRLFANETEGFSKTHITEIKNAYDQIASIFKITNNEVLAMLFRIGKSESPTSRSTKLKPKITFSV